MRQVDQHAHAALRIVDEGRTDKRAESGVEKADKMFRREMRQKGMNRLNAASEQRNL